MSDAVHFHGVDDAPVFARAMAEALASGREFAVGVESDAGDERLAYTVRREAGAIKLRDSDLSDVGTFADVGAALRAAGRMMERRTR